MGIAMFVTTEIPVELDTMVERPRENKYDLSFFLFLSYSLIVMFGHNLNLVYI